MVADCGRGAISLNSCEYFRAMVLNLGSIKPHGLSESISGAQ